MSLSKLKPRPGIGRGRKPVTATSAAYMLPKDAIWAAIRATDGPFTRDEIEIDARRLCGYSLNSSSTCDFLQRLLRADILELVRVEQGQGAARAKWWRLVNDTGSEAPVLNANGEPGTQGMGQEQLWRSMHMLKRFSLSELKLAASTEIVSVTESTASSYCKHLCRAGYLVRCGRINRRTLYAIVPGTYYGPRAPMVTKVKAIYDPNLGELLTPLDAETVDGGAV